jgi:uncharacterized membrane protein
MLDYLWTAPAQAVIWVTILIIMTILAVYFLRNWRDRVKHEDTTSEQLTKFRELRHRGVLSDTEFRTIKTALGDKLQDELRGDADQG